MLTSRRQFMALTAATPVVAAFGSQALAATPRIYAENGIAIDGSDAVAYFEIGAPKPGDPNITYDWNGATWRFASTAHRDAFAANPDAYAPQYGGYCAFAVSRGYTAATVPEAWKIVDGRLFLNFSNRIQRRWERDIPGNIAKGDANWPSVLNT